MENSLNQQQSFFNDLVKNNQASIYRICRAYLYDISHADDLYQEIMYQAWKSIQSFKGDSKPGTWIYRIAVNTAINYNLKHKRHMHSGLPDSLQLVFEETLSQKQQQEAQLDKLRYCINQLPAPERIIISLVLEDKSYKEIAEITGASVSHAGVKINRIKARLLKLMESIKP